MVVSAGPTSVAIAYQYDTAGTLKALNAVAVTLNNGQPVGGEVAGFHAGVVQHAHEEVPDVRIPPHVRVCASCLQWWGLKHT